MYLNSATSSVQSAENNTLYDEIRRVESITNLESAFNVRHGYFRWTIRKFSAFPEKVGIYCCSPIFQLQETWWYIALYPSKNIDGRNGISLHLSRCNRDPGPNNVGVSYALGLENAQNKIRFQVVENVTIGKGWNSGIQTSILGNMLEFLTENTVEESVTVFCEIYVCHLSYGRNVSVDKISSIDEFLSSNLADLLRSQENADVEIKNRNQSVLAHKSILCARSKTFSRLLEDGKSLHLSLSNSCLDCVIFYMYSGSFEYLEKQATFGIGLYEAACELSLRNLRDYLTPYKIEKESELRVNCFKRTYTFQKFNLAQLSNGNIYTQEAFYSKTGMRTKICIHRLNNPAKPIGINIEIGGISKVFHINIKVSVLNKNCIPFRDVLAEVSDSPIQIRNSTLFSSYAISDEEVLSSLTDRQLFINLKCTKYSLKKKSVFSAHINYPPNDRSIWSEELSSDLRMLFENEKLSDFTLIVEKERFKVHRSILAARSPYFYILLWEDNWLQNVLELSDIEPRILRIMLTYIYCGSISHIGDLSMEDFSKLIQPAVKYGIQSLAQICVILLNLIPRRSVLKFLNSQLPYITSNVM